MPPLAARRRPLAASLAALLLLSALGCAKTGSMLALGPRRSSIREQLSRMTFQNQQLKDELEVARDESRRLANDLQLAEIDKGDLKRRVESYQSQLARSGSAADDSYAVARPDPGATTLDPRTTRPAAQPPGRTAPFTVIPNRGASIDVTPPPGPSYEDSPASGFRASPPYESRPRPQIDMPPVKYFDLSPSAGRSDLGAATSIPWSPQTRGLARSDRDYR